MSGCASAGEGVRVWVCERGVGVVLRSFSPCARTSASPSRLSRSPLETETDPPRELPGVGVGVEEKTCEAGDEMGTEGDVDSWPEVVYGVRSRTSGKLTLHVFLCVAYDVCRDLFRCSTSTGGGYEFRAKTLNYFS